MLILSYPAVYTLELTAECNNRCQGCSNIYSEARTPVTLPATTWATLLADFATQATQLRLSGGEPFLHPEFFDILESVTAYNIPVTIFTNARWRNPEALVKRLEGWPNLSGLLVSLHGAQAESHEFFTHVAGSFDEACANIRLAVDSGLNVTLSTIITHQSYDEVDAVVAWGQAIGVRRMTFARYLGRPLPGVEPTAAELRLAIEHIETLKKAGAPVAYGIDIPQCFVSNGSTGCMAGVAYVTIDPWGNVRPCNHSPTIIGSLHEHSMADLWHNDKMNAWRALMPAECTTCAAYAVCHGGCRAVQELRPDKRDPLRGEPLVEYSPMQRIKELPAAARPSANFKLREETFGYAILGQGQVVPVAREALQVLNACDGNLSFAQLAEQFGQPGLDLLGELWELGLLKTA
ncbi:MAG: radical SAM protein [Anaerolineae bacterium]|nr:radical SAM protein [Anaerolineae bacterium]